MRCLLSILFIFKIILFQCYSQNNTDLNFYLSKLKSAKSDTAQLHIYTALTEVCDFEEIPLYAEEAVKLSNKLLTKYVNDDKIKLQIILDRNLALNNLGVYYYENNNFKEALRIWETLSISYDSLYRIHPTNYKILRTHIDVLNNLGSVYESIDKYDAALGYYFKGARFAENIKDTMLMSRIYNNLGFIYKYMTAYENSLNYYYKALKLKEATKDSNGIVVVLNNIAKIYLEKREDEKSEQYFLKCLEISKKINNQEMTAIAMTNLGKVYTNLLEFNKALNYLKEGMKFFSSLNKELEIGQVYLDIANLYFNMLAKGIKIKYIDSVTFYLKKTEFIGIKYKDNRILLGTYDLWGNLWFVQNDYKQGYGFHKKYDSIKSLLNMEEKKLSGIKQQMEYEFGQIIFKNKTEYNKNMEIAKEKNEKQRQLLIFTVVGLIFTIIFLIIIVFFLKKVAQKNKIIQSQKIEVENQKQIIENKQKDILDSIYYSKLIQKSILPHRSDIWKTLPQSFVIYRPKDIVSGDFYWFQSIGDYCLIAVADCTGHGVPGAFMSILNNDKLNEAINHTHEVDEILLIVNNNIKKTLKQLKDNKSLTKDGMDIILLKIPYTQLHQEFDSIKIEFAGANRPLFIYRYRQKNIEEIKTNKCSIGGFTEENQIFDKYTVELFKNDVIYLTTDGFIDQFGGSKNKKLMSSGFKNLILNIAEMHYQQQKDEIEKFFEKWKGENEQTDDVCIIGIKI